MNSKTREAIISAASTSAQCGDVSVAVDLLNMLGPSDEAAPAKPIPDYAAAVIDKLRTQFPQGAFTTAQAYARVSANGVLRGVPVARRRQSMLRALSEGVQRNAVRRVGRGVYQFAPAAK